MIHFPQVRWLPGLVLLSGLAGCWGPQPLAQLQTGFDAPAGGLCKIELDRGEIVSVSVPIRVADIPELVTRRVNAVMPGGRTLYLARESGPRGGGYRWVKRVRLTHRDQRRSMLVAADGRVLDRSHELQSADAPAAVLDTAGGFAQQLGAGKNPIQWIGQVFVGDSSESVFEVLIKDREGRQYRLECSKDGRRLRTVRMLTAELGIGR